MKWSNIYLTWTPGGGAGGDNGVRWSGGCGTGTFIGGF